MAERSMESLDAVGRAAFSSAIRRIGMLLGEVRSATAPGTNENPVMAPPVLRLTMAVTCCHNGFAAMLISSPHFRKAGNCLPHRADRGLKAGLMLPARLREAA
jgi:hypothetical protein